MALSAPGARADFAASAVASSGAAVVVWFRHRGARWRLEAATREPGRARFGAPQPLSAFVRRPCCTSVSVAIGARGDAVATWTSTARPAVWAALRAAGQRFRAPQLLARDASDAPRVVVGDGGAVALIYSTQHVPLRAGDGLQLRRAPAAGAFGPAEHVNPGGGVTIADAAVDARRARARGLARPGARRARAPVRGRAGPAAGGDRRAGRRRERQAHRRGGRRRRARRRRLVAAGPRPVRERVVAALRPAPGAPFARGRRAGPAWQQAEPGLARLVPGGGALVAWNAARYGGPAQRRSALLVTRLP